MSMEKLIEKLNQDQVSVFASLDKVKHVGIHTPDGQKFLLKANRKLLKHLYLEISVMQPLVHKQESIELKRLLRYYKSEITRFIRESNKYTQKSYLLSIQGKDCNQSFARLLDGFKKNLNLEQLLIARKLSQLDHGKTSYISWKGSHAENKHSL